MHAPSPKNVVLSIFSNLVFEAKQWDLRGFVLMTLFLQTLLLFVAPFRKQTSNSKFLAVVWFAYLMSDWASNFATGLIPASKDQASTAYGSDLLMFWAPFLLLHVGGTDSIAALTSTDNELWSRFAIQLATMTYAIGNAFYRSFVVSRLRVPVLLMFVAGLTKYAERLLCFKGSRFSSLKELMLEERAECGRKPLDLDSRNISQLSDSKMVRDACHLFKSFNSLYVDLEVDSDDRKKSREYFQVRNSKDAFRVVEIELNLSYEMFYTKGAVLRQGLGRFLRPLCMICEVVALVLWLPIDKHNFQRFDIRATYALLIGAVARDFISLLMVVFSDWTIASIQRNSDDSAALVNWWLSLRKQRWDNYSSSKEAPFLIFMSRALLRRWSESISQLNFIDQCFDKLSEGKERSYEALGIDFFFNKLKRVPKKWFANELRDLIYRELIGRVDQQKTSLSRGQWTLESYGPENKDLLILSTRYVEQKTFDESLLMWHIATTLCYHTEKQESLGESERQCRELSRILSDYMLYLLLRRPEMMLQVAAVGNMRYDDTRVEAKKFFQGFFRRNTEGIATFDEGRYSTPQATVKRRCRRLLREVRHYGRLRDIGNSVLIDACRLAIQLKGLEKNQGVKMWELIPKVWVEMLGYAASTCTPSAHVAQLANGGELVTLVWLLMEHIGLGKN